MTLPEFLKAHSDALKTEFGQFLKEEKGAYLTAYLQAKKDKEDVMKRVSNVAISKEVDSKFDIVAAIV